MRRGIQLPGLQQPPKSHGGLYKPGAQIFGPRPAELTGGLIYADGLDAGMAKGNALMGHFQNSNWLQQSVPD